MCLIIQDLEVFDCFCFNRLDYKRYTCGSLAIDKSTLVIIVWKMNPMYDSKVAKLESQSAKMHGRPPGIAAYIVVCCFLVFSRAPSGQW